MDTPTSGCDSGKFPRAEDSSPKDGGGCIDSGSSGGVMKASSLFCAIDGSSAGNGTNCVAGIMGSAAGGGAGKGSEGIGSAG